MRIDYTFREADIIEMMIKKYPEWAEEGWSVSPYTHEIRVSWDSQQQEKAPTYLKEE